MEKEPITLQGLEKLKEELVFLKEKKRPEIVAAIAEARSHGDLKENAEYHAAKEQQSHNEGRIEEINDIIRSLNPKRFDTSHLLKEKKSYKIAFVFERFNETGGAAFTHRLLLTTSELQQQLSRGAGVGRHQTRQLGITCQFSEAISCGMDRGGFLAWGELARFGGTHG